MFLSKRIQITLKDDVAKLLEQLSEEMGVTKSVVVTLAVQEYEKNKGKLKK